MYGKSKLYFSNISLVGAESAPTFTIWGRKAPPYIINDGFNGKIKEAYEKYENIIFSVNGRIRVPFYSLQVMP